MKNGDLLLTILVQLVYPIMAIWMAVGLVVYSVTELFRYLLGKSEEEYHPPEVHCTPTNRCEECLRKNRYTIILGCISLALIALAFFGLFRLIANLGVIPVVLIALAFFGISWLFFKLCDYDGRA